MDKQAQLQNQQTEMWNNGNKILPEKQANRPRPTRIPHSSKLKIPWHTYSKQPLTQETQRDGGEKSRVPDNTSLPMPQMLHTITKKKPVEASRPTSLHKCRKHLHDSVQNRAKAVSEINRGELQEVSTPQEDNTQSNRKATSKYGCRRNLGSPTFKLSSQKYTSASQRISKCSKQQNQTTKRTKCKL